jgi:triosephosphate isomerase (TIM)
MKTIVANWKMNVGVRESVALARASLLLLRGKRIVPDLVLCSSHGALSEVRKVLARSSASLGAQDMADEEQGAFTGETSVRLLTELGVSHVILGHSERRDLYGETDEMVNKKVLLAIKNKLIPIICIGETKDEKESNKTRDVVKSQLTKALHGVKLRGSNKLMIAYEPRWAIGTGETPDVNEVIEIHQFIREILEDVFSSTSPEQLSVLYGGSVKKENAYSFMRESQIDGVLVGGASVKISQFKNVVEAAIQVLEAQE